MDERLINYLDKVFSAYEDSQTIRETKEELLGNLQEKLIDFMNQGYDNETAYHKTITSLGDISELLSIIPARQKEQLVLVERDFSDTDLRNANLTGIKVQHGRFNDSTFKGADFSGSDLSNGSFKDSELVNVKFDGTNLSGAKMRRADLRGASFKGSVLDNTDFNGADLSGVNFDNLTFKWTIFDNAQLKGASFKNAVFNNVSFKDTLNLKKAEFTGARMDKFTYGQLRGQDIIPPDVTII